jgi:hypothetical protein
MARVSFDRTTAVVRSEQSVNHYSVTMSGDELARDLKLDLIGLVTNKLMGEAKWASQAQGLSTVPTADLIVQVALDLNQIVITVSRPFGPPKSVVED